MSNSPRWALIATPTAIYNEQWMEIYVPDVNKFIKERGGDVARTMCIDAEGDETNYEAYKGRAHKLFHEFRNAVRLGNGERIGTDKATEVKP